MSKDKKICSKCHVNESNGQHTCPFKTEICNCDDKCDCCDVCRQLCDDET